MIYYFLGLFVLFLLATFCITKPLKSSAITKIIMGLGLGIISMTAYLSLGTGNTYWYSTHHPELLQFYYALENPALPLRAYKPLADQAARTLGSSSKDVPGWLLLSQFYLSINDLHFAAFGLEKAHEGDPADEQIATHYAQLSFSANQGVFTPAIQKLLPKLVKKNPENQQASLLLAMLFSQQGNYEAALRLWRKIELQVPPASMEAKLIHSGIKKAEGLLKKQQTG